MAQSNAFKFANNILTNGGYDATDLVGAVGGGTNTPAFRVKLASNQNIANAITVLAAFSSVEFDTDSAYTNTATNYKFTVPSGKAGKYVINVSLRYQAFASARKESIIYKNGSAFYNIENAGTGGGIYDTVNGSVLLDLLVGDYIQIYAAHDQGTTQQIRDDSFFEGFKLI